MSGIGSDPGGVLVCETGGEGPRNERLHFGPNSHDVGYAVNPQRPLPRGRVASPSESSETMTDDASKTPITGSLEHSVTGCLLGTAVGDALGLPYEGLSPQRAARWLGEPDRYRFCFGRGMVSDDTEHACIVAQTLISVGDDPSAFARELTRRLRWWLLGMPAGIGWATLRAALWSWCGVSPDRSGVFSAGNGPAMRSAILGLAVDDEESRQQLVRASTRLTHTDPKAEIGARAVAWAARWARDHEKVDATEFAERLRDALRDLPAAEFLTLLDRVLTSCHRGESTPAFAETLGLSRGVSGYMYHTVPVVLHAWLTHPRDYRAAVMTVIRCGGDADTTAAIVGGIVGSAVGESGIPVAWLTGLCEWPRTVPWLRRLASTLVAARTTPTCVAPKLPVLGLLARNAWFASVVLLHGFRRLAPPYA